MTEHFLQRPIAGLTNDRLAHFDAQRTILQDQASHSNGFIQCCAIWNNLVNQAEPKQLLGRHAAAGECELHRYAVGHLTGKPEQAAPACSQASRDLGNAEFRALSSDYQVTRQRKLEASG